MVNADSERRQDIPKKRWLHNVENDLRNMGVRRCTSMGSKMTARTIMRRSEKESDTLSHKMPV